MEKIQSTFCIWGLVLSMVSGVYWGSWNISPQIRGDCGKKVCDNVRLHMFEGCFPFLDGPKRLPEGVSMVGLLLVSVLE